MRRVSATLLGVGFQRAPPEHLTATISATMTAVHAIPMPSRSPVKIDDPDVPGLHDLLGGRDDALGDPAVPDGGGPEEQEGEGKEGGQREPSRGRRSGGRPRAASGPWLPVGDGAVRLRA
jgi:hypothetical protein